MLRDSLHSGDVHFVSLLCSDIGFRLLGSECFAQRCPGLSKLQSRDRRRLYAFECFYSVRKEMEWCCTEGRGTSPFVVHADQISNIKRILYKTIIGRNYIIQTHLVPTDALCDSSEEKNST